MIKRYPEFRYYIWGLFAKFFGGLVFSLIYFYYYNGGDTIAYFYSAVSMSKLARIDVLDYLTVLFGESSMENRQYFTYDTGYPYGYVYYDPRTFFIIRCISPLVILAMDSYLITTVVLSSLAYFGIWKAFRTFVSYFPSLTSKFAIAFLFMPSVIFWGSAILKDTFTFSATCWWIYCIDSIFFKGRSRLANGVGVMLSAVVMIIVKPYIFMVLLPITLLWLLHKRIVSIRNLLVKFVVIPIGTAIVTAGSIYLLNSLGSYFDKFSLDKALTTITITQSDMSRAEQYGSNYFDVGQFDATWSGLLSKFPIAVNAGLFRPYLWEANNFVMALSALENIYLLAVFLITLFKAGPMFFIRIYMGNPLVLFCLSFALVFAFVIGISTPNFGALVRFKIPLIPFFVSGLFIIGLLKVHAGIARNRGQKLDLSKYWSGEGNVKVGQSFN